MSKKKIAKPKKPTSPTRPGDYFFQVRISKQAWDAARLEKETNILSWRHVVTRLFQLYATHGSDLLEHPVIIQK